MTTIVMFIICSIIQHLEYHLVTKDYNEKKRGGEGS